MLRGSGRPSSRRSCGLRDRFKDQSIALKPSLRALSVTSASRTGCLADRKMDSFGERSIKRRVRAAAKGRLRVPTREYRPRVQRHRRLARDSRTGNTSRWHTRHRVALAQPRVTSVILGTKRIEQLNEKLGAVDILLTGEELRSLDQVSQLPPEYPGWTLEMWSQPRAKQLKDSRT